MSGRNAERGARRLVRLYPREWRRRFGDEFEQLLIDEMAHPCWSAMRTANVVGHAVLAHLTVAGLTGRALAPRVQAWRALRALGLVAVLFLVIGIGMWSQMAVGWTWASPTSQDARTAMGLMSGALLGLGAMFVVAVSLVSWSIVRGGRRRLGPLLAAGTCGGTLWIGCMHFSAQWPGSGTSGWEAHSVVPAGLGRIGWAATLWISAYWTHPGTLLARPADVLGWMVISPLLLAGVTAAGPAAARGVSPSTWLVRTLACLGVASVVLGALFVAGAAVWILGATPGPRLMFQPGSVDDVGLALLMSAVLIAAHIAGRGLRVVHRPVGT